MADDDYEHFWKTVRPNRRVSPPVPETQPEQTNPRNYQGQQGQETPLNIEHIRDLERLLSAEQLRPVARTPLPTRHQASWMEPNQGTQQLTDLVTAFTALGIPIDVFLELQDDQHATSTLEIVIDRQTIRIESNDGTSFVRVFDRIDRL